MADNKYIQPPNSVVFLFGDDQGNVYTVPSNEYSKADAAFRDSGREVVELERVVVNGEPTFRKHRDWLSNEERKLRDAEDEAFVAKGGSLKSGTPYFDLVADEPTLKFRDEDESGYQQNRKADYYRNEKALTEAFGEYDPDHEPSWLDVPKNIAKQTARVAVDATAGVALGLGHLVNSAGWLVTGAGHTRASEWFEDRIDKASRVSEAVREFSDSLDPYKDATTIPEAWRTAGDVAHQASVITTQMAMFSALNKGLKAPAPSAGGAVVPAGEAATGVGAQAVTGAGGQAATGVGSKVVALAGEAVKQTAPTMILQGADVFGSTQAQAVNAGASVGEATIAATGAGLFAGATSVASYMLGGTFRGGSGFGSRVVNEMAEEASKAVGGRVSASVLANAFSNGDEAVKIFTVAMSKATPGVMRSVGRALVGAGIEGTLGGSRTWVQMSLLQGAGVEISDADKWEAVQSSFLFSFAGAAATEVGAVYSNFRSLAKFRKQYAQNREQMARGARAQAQSQQPLLGDGSMGERSPAPVRVNDGRPGGARVVEPNGDVRFADGTTVHANGSMTVANGAVVDRNGQLMTKGPATSDAGRETLDLFALIKGGDMRVYELPLDQVKVNDRIKQFKGDADAKTGVVQRLEGQYMPIPTKPILVMQFNDGSMEVVTGRHRYDLAKRNGMTVIPANVIRESDGWSVKMAQVMDAYDNILDEKGSDQDFVKFFRESKITDDEINDHRELVSRPRQKMARDVARYGSEELYSFVMDKHSLVTLDVAAAIAQNAPLGKSQWSTNIQRACIRGVLQDGMRAGEVAIYARGLQQAYNDRALKSQMAQLDLFGEDSTFDLSMRLQSKYASRKVGEIELDLSSFKQLVNRRGENLTAKKKLLEKYNLANDADTGAIQRVISDLEMQKKAWQNYHLDPALSREAKAYADKELHIAPVVVETESGEIQSLQQVEATLLQGDEALKKAEIEQSVSYGMSDAEDDLFALGEREGPTYEASVDAQIAADYDGVVEQYKNTDQWLKAPNGKPTNLDEREWVQARTPSFKKWFGDWENDPANASKMVDENGEPKVYYHGTNNGDFNEFDSSYIGVSSGDDGFFGRGFYFAYTKGEASYYGAKRIIPAFLNIKNPFNHYKEFRYYNGEKGHYSDTSNAIYLINFAEKFPEIAKDITIGVAKKGHKVIKEIPVSEFAKVFKDVVDNKTFTYSEYKNDDGAIETIVTADPKKVTFKVGDETRSFVDHGFNRRFWGTEKDFSKLDVAYTYLENAIYSYIDMPKFTRVILDNNRAFTDELKRRGYDGIIQSELGDEAVAFNSNQIKHATDNSGAFSKADNNILREQEGPMYEASVDAQIAADHDGVVAQYKGTDQWLKAPNGKHTKLSEKQWVQSRTPAFKAFFGDWEALAEITAPIDVSLNGAREKLRSLAGKPLVNLATGIVAQINNIQRNKIVSAVAVRKSIRNGFSAEEHNAAASMIDKLWKYAELAVNTQDKDGDVNIKSIKRFVSPILFSHRATPVFAWMTIKETERNGSRIYSIELEKLETLEGRLKEQNALSSSSVSNDIIAKLISQINNVSKVVDENGEPLVVYHGSPHKFEAFSSKKMGVHGTSKGKGYYFTPIKNLADGYVEDGGNLYEVFLNIRKPLGYDNRTMTRSDIARLIDAIDRRLESEVGKDMGILMEFGNVHSEGRANVLKSATELIDSNASDVDVFSELVTISGNYDVVASVIRETLGYDGIIPTDTNAEVVALNPDQAKSATDNVGTFDSGDNNILREPEAQLDLFADLPEQQRLFDINRYDGLSPEETAVRQEEDARVDALRPADEPDDVDLSKTWLRKLKPGEKCLMERRFTEDKAFSFTGGEKIASVEDVAYVFRSLEDEAVEHVFFGAVKDGKLHVVHASMGALNNTVIDSTVLGVMIRRLNPDKVYMIHNHPSGELTASSTDINTLNNLRNQFGDVVSEEGIIIDQRSGLYATFNGFSVFENPGAHAVGLFNAGSGEKRYTTMSPDRAADVPVKVFNFSKRVFNKDFSLKDLRYIGRTSDVTAAYFNHLAALTSAQRLSDANKLSVFVLNHTSRIVGDFVVTGRDAFDIVDEVSEYVDSTGGSKVILFGRMDEEMFGRVASKVSEAARGRLNVVDVVNFDENFSSVSARGRGMMRNAGEMIPRPAHGDVLRENDPEPAFALQYRTANFTDHVVSEPGQDVDLFGANALPGLKSTFVPADGAPGDQAPTVFTVEGVPGVMVRALDGAVEVRGLDQVVSQQQAAQVLDDLMQRDVRVVLDDASLLALGEKGRAMLEAHNGGLQDRARESVYPKDEADPATLEVRDSAMSPRRGGGLPRSTLEVEVYPNGGRVPVAGSMAANASLLPLSLHHVVSMYRQLADGRSPAVVAQNNRGPRRALGWFHIASKSIAVRAQLFGLVDASDLRILHDMLKKHGLFRHEDPTWCAMQTKARQAMEKQISEARLERELNRLVDARIKRGQHTGVGTKVLAHELWHLIDELSEVKVPAKANLLDHMAMVKSAISQVQKRGALVTNARLVAEAEAFIPVWRGVDHLEEHFKDPSEMFAEMGAALMLDPKAVQAMAPTYYDVMLEGLKQHPKALDAWQAISDSIARGADIDETLQTLAASWSREFEANVRKVRNEMTSRTKFDKKMETVYTFMDRYGPMVMVVERSQQAVKAKLKKDLEAGNISRALYDQEMKSLDAQLLDIKYQRALYTHQYGRSRLFLADLNEKVIEACRTLGVDFVDVNKYMHLKRVLELRDRATAHGIDAPMAHKALKAMAKAKGLAEMRKVVQVARTFRALYEQHVINNPSVREMLGPAAIKMMEENKHYVSMKHTVGSDELAHIERQRSAMADPEGGENPLDVALQNVFGLTVQSGDKSSSSGAGFALKRLVGSFRATKSPVLATAQTAVAILEAAQKNHALIQLADALKKNKFVDFKLLAPGEKAPNNDRFGTVDFMRDGVKQTMIVPRVVADAFGVAPQMIGKLSIVSRFINAVFTTNNPTFPVTAYNRDLSALSINNPGLKRSALHFMSVLNFGAALSLFNVVPLAKPVVRTAQNLLSVGSYVPFVAQLIPPHWMDRMSKSAIGRLLFNEKTVEYWTSYGHKCAKIIQDMSFEATLQEAAEARARGNLAKAESLEYCVTMARHALEDGVLLTMTQMRKDNYNRSDLARLFDKYNLKYDDLETYGPMDNKIRKALRQLRANPTKALALSTWQLLQGLWNGAGYINEVSSMTVKLAGYCAFHHERAKKSYDDSVDGSREVALQTVDRAGDPDFSRRGMVAHYLEVFISPFWNAKKEGFARTVRAAKANFSDWSGKMFMEGVLPRIMEFMISSGALAALLLKSCSKSGQPEELEGTAAGELYDFCEWNRAAMRNVSPYVRENYRVLPLWMSGDGSTTVSLKLPIPTESAVAEKAVIAAWNMLDGGKASGRPMVGPMDVAGEFLQQFLPDFEQSGSIMGAVNPFIGMVMGYNPYSAYKQESFFTDEEYAARWTRPDAAIAASRNLWNYSPLVSVKRLRDTSKQGDIPEDMAVLKELLEAPLVGPYLARFMSVDSRGVEQTVNQFVREDKAKQAAMLLDVDQHIETWKKTGSIPKEVFSDIQMTDAFLKAMKKDIGKPGSFMRAWNKAMNIKSPEIRQKAIDYLNDRPKVD